MNTESESESETYENCVNLTNLMDVNLTNLMDVNLMDVNLLDAIEAAQEFRVVQIGYVKHISESKHISDSKDQTYDLYQTISDIPMYVIRENEIKIIGINHTFLPNYKRI